jgi:hypothetical protein
LGGQGEAVETRLDSNPVEFDGIKRRVVEALPYPQKFDGISIAQPISDKVVSTIRILVTGNVSQAYVIILFL